ncbi:hypothetical protein M758_9G135200 [Ceratodon purpureus]|nr:hypothetical protein M758_9G135200 [Ceratodon purpureus]
MEMETIVAQVMAILPPKMIKVEKSQRTSKFETIVEESISLDEECAASIITFGEVAPAPVITVKKQAFRSSLDTIWEERMQHVAEYFVSEVADAIRRSSPDLRLNHFENISSQFFIDSRGGLIWSSEVQ